MTHRRTAALTFGLATLWLALGWLNVSRGAAHAGAGYRAWAYEHHCYSDVIALHGDHYLSARRPLPYLEDRIEYPVLLGLALWIPTFGPGGPARALVHFTLTYLGLALCLLAALALLFRTPGAAPWWLGATPAVVYYAGLNWDLLPVALLAAGVLSLSTDRPAATGALAGLGASAKLFPAALVPPAAALLAARAPRRRALRLAAALAAVILAVNLPLALARWDTWSWFFRFNAARGAENSLWDALGLKAGPLLDVLSAAPVAAAALLGAVATFRAARAGEEASPRSPFASRSGAGGGGARAARLATALSLVVWIATNKIWSPQYALYGFLAGAIAAAPPALFLVLSAVSVLDFHLAFEVRARSWEPAFRDGVWHPMNVVRALLWLVLAAWIGRELWRAARGQSPRPPASPTARQ